MTCWIGRAAPGQQPQFVDNALEFHLLEFGVCEARSE